MIVTQKILLNNNSILKSNYFKISNINSISYLFSCYFKKYDSTYPSVRVLYAYEENNTLYIGYDKIINLNNITFFEFKDLIKDSINDNKNKNFWGFYLP